MKANYILAALVSMLPVFQACHEKPEENVEIELKQCLTPAQLAYDITGMDVAFSWTVAKDAESYNLVIASDPACVTVVESVAVAPEDVPYAVELAEGEYYFKVQAIAGGKDPSNWAIYDGMVKVEDNAPAIDLSAAATANCYVVNTAGKYKFRSNKANTSTAIEGITDVVILWETSTEDETATLAPNSVIAKVSYKDGYIEFATPKTFKPGNALIAARNITMGTDETTGEAVEKIRILWSWHIWLTSEPIADVTVGDIVLMDRNLGELSASARTSMLYQWGRKDPFPGSYGNAKKVAVAGEQTTARGSSIKSYAENPTVLSGRILTDGADFIHKDLADLDLWGTGDDKTEQDPCPAGYKVPHAGTDTSNDISKTPFAALSGLTFNSGVFTLGSASFSQTGCYLLNTISPSVGSADLLIEENTCYLWTASRNAKRQGGCIRISEGSAAYWIKNKDAEAPYQAKNNAFAVRCQKM